MDDEPDLLDRIRETAVESLTVSSLISIKSFIAKWRSILTFDEVSIQNSPALYYDSVIGPQNKIPEEIWEELFIVTNPIETLHTEGITPLKPIKMGDVPDDVKLQTVRNTRERTEKKQSDNNFYQLVNACLEFNIKCDEHLAHKHAILGHERRKDMQGKKPRKVEKNVNGPPEHLLIPDAIVTMCYNKPQNAPHKADIKREAGIVTLHVISQNSLAQLRDAIKCHRDLEIPGDFSEAPDAALKSKMAKDIFPSAMFFIEDVFYIDRRTFKAQDYSVGIVEWLKKKGVTREFSVQSMARVKMLDMQFRLGMPYVYIHQGNCEHVIQFTDLRLVNSDDCQEASAYPIRLTQNGNKLMICNACQIRGVKWMLLNSILSPSDPAHYCDICFKMLHYNGSGGKVCDFTAYRYTDNAFQLIDC